MLYYFWRGKRSGELLDIFSIGLFPIIVALLLVIPVLALLVLAPLRLFAIDRHLREILEELKRVNSQLRGPSRLPPPSASAGPGEWVQEFKEAADKTKKGLEEKLKV